MNRLTSYSSSGSSAFFFDAEVPAPFKGPSSSLSRSSDDSRGSAFFAAFVATFDAEPLAGRPRLPGVFFFGDSLLLLLLDGNTSLLSD